MQEALQDLATPGRPAKVEPETAVEVIAASDAKRKRVILGAFIERVTVAADGVTIKYRPEALLNAGSGTSVRSVNRWLPDLGSNQGPTD